MTKTEKKLDNSIVKALTTACETLKIGIAGFTWLTHFSNYRDFPESFIVICIFDTNTELTSAQEARDDVDILNTIKNELQTEGVKIKNIHKHVSFDTEENCRLEDNGNWNKRFKRL